MNHLSIENLVNGISFENAVIQGKELLAALMLLSLFILTFNYPDIFISKSLYLDDYHRYMLGLEGKLHETIIARNSARAYVIFPLYKLLSIDVVWARLASVLFFYIPLSFSVFYLLRKQAKVAPVVAFFVSLLPCILPGQLQIPGFIDGSYTLQGLLVYICSLLVSLNFMAKARLSWGLFSASVLLYFFAIEMMDQAIFLLPFSIASFIVISDYRQKKYRIIALAGINSFLAIQKIIYTLNYPTSSMSIPIEPTWQEFFYRSASYIHSVLPFSYSYNKSVTQVVIIGSCFSLIALLGFYYSNRRERILLLLGLFWVLCTSIVFLTVSRYYSPRYTHIPAFGINFIIVMSLWVLFNRFKVIPNRHVGLLLLLICLSLFSGVKRFQHINKVISPQNEVHESIIHDLKKYDIPDGSQIAIVEGHRIPTGGWWMYSSGFMKFSTDINDVTGIIGLEKGFYDPFGIDKRDFQYEHQMSGLDLDAPIFLFRQYCAAICELKQKKYALQWMEGSWNLFEFDLKSGKIVNTSNGVGYDEYMDFIDKHNLTAEDVIFSVGNPKPL